MKPGIKKILKRLAIGIVLLGCLGVILGLIFFGDIKNWIEAEVQDYLTQLEYGDLEIGEMDLALIQHFPHMTVEMDQVRFYEQKDSLRPPDVAPILTSEQFNITFNSWELIRRKHLIVTILNIENGELDIVTYEDNKTNLERAFDPPKSQKKLLKSKDSAQSKKSTPKPTKPKPTKPNPQKPANDVTDPAAAQALTIQLEKIQLKNITIKYKNPSENYASQINLADFQGNLVVNEQGISSTLNTNFEIVKSEQLPTIAKQGPMSLALDLDFIDASQLIEIHEGSLNFKNLDVIVSGSYDHRNGNYLDMDFDASSNNISFISNLVQEDILHKNSSLVEKAKIIFNGKIKGKMEDQLPVIDVNFGIDDLSMELPEEKGELNDFGFEGEFHTGTASDFSSANLSLRKLRGKMPGGSISGTIDIRNFKNPYVKSSLKLSLVLDGFDDLFQLANIDSLQGKIDFVSDMDGLLNLENQHEMDSIGSWSLKMKDIGFKHLSSDKFVSKLNGTITEANNQVEIKELGMFYDKSTINISGQIQNLYHFIFNKEQDLLANLELTSDQLYTEHFITNPKKQASINDRMSNLRLQAQITMNDNDIFDSYFPKINATLSNVSFELDKLPGVSKLDGKIECWEAANGFNIQIHGMDVNLPIGETKVTGTVLIPNTSKTLDIATNIDIKNIPKEYVLDLLGEMKDRELLGAKNLGKHEMTLINANLGVAGVMELVPFALQKASISNASVSMLQPDSTLQEIRNLNLKLDGLYFDHIPGSNKIAGIENAKGELHIDAVNIASFAEIPIDIGLVAKNDKFDLSFSTLRDTVMLDQGSLSLDISKSPFELGLNYKLENIDIAEVVRDYNSENLMQGTINAATEINGVGDNLEELIKNLEGNVNISGDSLILHGVDLDDLLRKYNRSQKFNLADVSAFLMAGPIGAAVTKGADFTSLIAADFKPEHTTFVSKAIANWKIDHGILATDDVAFSTRANRLAFHGSLDFVKDSIPGFTIYVVDKKGCSLMQQNISGKFGAIQMGKLKIAKTLLGSVINLVNSVVGSKCEAVYTGTIAHPDTSKK